MTVQVRRMGFVRTRALGVLAMLLFAPGIAADGADAADATPGVMIVRTDSSPVAGSRARSTTIKLTKTAVRIESDDASIIYRKDLDTAWMIQGDSYMVMDKAAARAMKNRIGQHTGAVQAEIDKALAAVPPENRAMIEQMMRQQGGGAPGMPGAAAPVAKPPKPTFTKGERGKVGPWACDVYDGKLDGQLVQRVCATGIGDLGLSDADVEILLYAAEFFWALSSEFGAQGAAPPPDLLGMEEEQGFPGYALSRKRYKGGQLQQESIVTKAERTEFDSALFAKPALKERKFGVPPPGAPK